MSKTIFEALNEAYVRLYDSEYIDTVVDHSKEVRALGHERNRQTAELIVCHINSARNMSSIAGFIPFNPGGLVVYSAIVTDWIELAESNRLVLTQRRYVQVEKMRFQEEDFEFE